MEQEEKSEYEEVNLQTIIDSLNTNEENLAVVKMFLDRVFSVLLAEEAAATCVKLLVSEKIKPRVAVDELAYAIAFKGTRNQIETVLSANINSLKGTIPEAFLKTALRELSG